MLVLDTHVFPKAALIAIRVATMDARRQMLGMVTAAAKVDKGAVGEKMFLQSGKSWVHMKGRRPRCTVRTRQCKSPFSDKAVGHSLHPKRLLALPVAAPEAT